MKQVYLSDHNKAEILHNCVKRNAIAKIRKKWTDLKIILIYMFYKILRFQT